MENKICNKCGAEMPIDAKFCTKCGQSNEEYTPRNHTHKEKLNKKSLYALLTVFTILFLIIFGTMFFSEYEERREARLAREKFVQDSINKARQDSIRLVRQREKEEKEAQLALQKQKMLIPIDVILDIYKQRDSNYAKRKLYEYGYNYFSNLDGVDYYTKGVQLTKAEGFHPAIGDYEYYEPVEKKGSFATINGYGNNLTVSIKVFTQKELSEWEKQLKGIGYKQIKYDYSEPGNDGWTHLDMNDSGRLYRDSKGSTVEFCKDLDSYWINSVN